MLYLHNNDERFYYNEYVLKEDCKMNNQERFKIAYRMTSRASTGLSFIEDYLTEHPTTDPAYLRSIYILLSYNTELILKSIVVMKNNFLNKNDVNKKLKTLLHDIEKIGKNIGRIQLLKLDISTIIKNGDQYILTTTDNQKICIEDFADIRYDFIDGKVKTVDNQEHERIARYAKQLRSILQKAKKENEKYSKTTI
jgi:hypothetical protein